MLILMVPGMPQWDYRPPGVVGAWGCFLPRSGQPELPRVCLTLFTAAAQLP